MNEFTKIVPSGFGPFIGHHQGWFACVKSVFFLRVFIGFFFISLRNCVNAKLDKTEMLMNEFNNRTLSTEIEYYRENRILKKKEEFN